MIALTVAVSAVAVVLVFDLLLTFGLIRRFRLWSGNPPSGKTTGPDVRNSLPAHGTEIHDFSFPTLDGGLFSRDSLSARATTVGFLSVGCVPCKSVFADLASRKGFSLDVAFVRGSSKDPATARFAEQLADHVATVVRFSEDEQESADGVNGSTLSPMSTFGIHGFPTLIRLDDGVVTASGLQLDEIR